MKSIGFNAWFLVLDRQQCSCAATSSATSSPALISSTRLLWLFNSSLDILSHSQLHLYRPVYLCCKHSAYKTRATEASQTPILKLNVSNANLCLDSQFEFSRTRSPTLSLLPPVLHSTDSTDSANSLFCDVCLCLVVKVPALNKFHWTQQLFDQPLEGLIVCL